jgi:hypothetical protein
MVPLSERRHRLFKQEIPEVILGLKLRLEQLLTDRSDVERAEVAFHCLHCLLEGSQGRPRYPDFSWEYLEYYLDQGVDHLLGEKRMVP